VEEVTEPRTITFAVGGTITLTRALKIRTPYVTIDGSTAPAPGITLHAWSLGIDETHDVIIRYLRFRSGYPLGVDHGPGGERSLSISGLPNAPTHDVIIDHCSIGFSDDDALSIWNNCYRITIQSCLLTGDPSIAAHGVIIGGQYATDHNEYLTFCNNVLTNFFYRNPLFGGPGRIDFYNNAVIGYIWGAEIRPGLGQTSARLNCMDNAYILPRSYPWPQVPNPLIGDPWGMTKLNLFLSGNFYRGWRVDDWEITGNNQYSGLTPLPTSLRRHTPWPTTAAPAPILRILTHLLDDAGCNRPVRDAIDSTFVRNAETGDIAFPNPTTPNPDIRP